MSLLNNIGHFIQHSGIDPVKSSITRPLQAGKDLIHGKPGAAFQDLRHIVSDNEKAQSKGLGDLGVRGWVGKHPLESAAAVVGTIVGGWAAMGAYGAGAAGGATGAAAGAGGAGAAGTAGGSGVAAGTVIGQTVPAIPSVASMTSGTGAAVTASPSYSIIAGASPGGVSLSSGGTAATHLGGEAQIGNTGLSSGSGEWFNSAKKYYDMYQKINAAKNATGQQGQQNKAPQIMDQQILPFQPMTSGKNYQLPTSITGLDLSNQNSAPDFTKGGVFGGLQ
ncbi:hypothetical protein RYG49_001263 [Salmonella enterica]|nr:hypothetical protein [Salmonella enterica]